MTKRASTFENTSVKFTLIGLLSFLIVVFQPGAGLLRAGQSFPEKRVKKLVQSTAESTSKPGKVRLHGLSDKDKLKSLLETYRDIPEAEKSPEDYKRLGIIHHNLAVAGEGENAKKSVEKLQKVREQRPEDPIALAYLGSAKTLQGYYAVNPVNKITYVNEGTALIDKAVEMAPDNVELRILRATNSRELPFFFGRYGYVKQDLNHLFELKEDTPSLFSPAALAQLYFLKAGFLRKTAEGEKQEEACDYWEKAARVKPESEHGKKAKQRYETYCNSGDKKNE